MTFSKLGTDIQTGQIVELPQVSRRQGLYIIGANGTGKTGLIENLILQDIDQGLGVGLLDPHGDLTNAILAKMTKRVDDVILLDITDKEYPFGLNLFECHDPTDPVEVQKIVDLVMHIFEKLFDVSRAGTPLLLDYLRNCTSVLVANPGYTMADIPLLFADQGCRQKLLANITDPYVRLFWQQYEQLPLKDQREEAASTMRRVREFLQPLSRNIVGQAKTTVNIQQVMDERKILLVKLSAQLDQVTSLIGSVIIAMILNAAYSRATIPINKRKQFNLYADEFQRFATEDFATLLTEARKFGIATTIAHQARYQPGMTDGIRAVSLQAANIVVFRVTSPDADELAGEFDTTPPPAQLEEIGTEEIRTPVKDVVHHLLNGGIHPTNPVVNQFAITLRKLTTDRQYSRSEIDIHLNKLNTLLYEAMTNQQCDTLLSIEALKYFLQIIEKPWPKVTYPILYRYVPMATSYDYSPWDYDAILQGVNVIWTEQPGSSLWQQWVNYLDKTVRTHIREQKLSLLEGDLFHLGNEYTRWHYIIKEKFEYGQIIKEPVRADRTPQEIITLTKTYWERKYPEETWYCLDVETYAAIHAMVSKMLPKRMDASEFFKMLCQYFYNPADLDRAVEAELQEQKTIFLNFLRELKQIMQALATEPIMTGSGQWMKKMRPGTVRPYQDVKNDIANQLSGLTNFTARVKIGGNAPQNPGKKCLSCGLLNTPGVVVCTQCGIQLPATNEYTITTLAPGQGIGKTALQQRIATIQARNRDPRYGGYCRPRQDVEAEILQRQASCSGSPPAQPHQPSPPHQPRHARQVPVQGSCPNCGKSNPPGAKFCNQCGTKL